MFFYLIKEIQFEMKKLTYNKVSPKYMSQSQSGSELISKQVVPHTCIKLAEKTIPQPMTSW